MERVGVKAETKEKLKELKEKLSEITGEKFTYDNTINLLLGTLLEDLPKEMEERAKLEAELKLLTDKLEFVRRVYPVRGKLSENLRNFYYFPDEILEKALSISEKSGIPVPLLLLSSAEVGLSLYGKVYYVLEDEHKEELFGILSKLPEGEKEKETKKLDNSLKTTVKLKIAELKRKYRKLLREKR